MVARFPLTVANDFAGMREAMDRFFQDATTLTASRPERSAWPAVAAQRSRAPMDVFVNEDEAVVIAAIPGIDPEGLDITVEQSTVTIAGEVPSVADSEEAQDATWYLQELPRGGFKRTLTLPFDIDSAASEATFEHGMLRLRLPKADAARPRQIKVTAGSATPVAAQATENKAEVESDSETESDS